MREPQQHCHPYLRLPVTHCFTHTLQHSLVIAPSGRYWYAVVGFGLQWLLVSCQWSTCAEPGLPDESVLSGQTDVHVVVHHYQHSLVIAISELKRRETLRRKERELTNLIRNVYLNSCGKGSKSVQGSSNKGEGWVGG